MSGFGLFSYAITYFFRDNMKSSVFVTVLCVMVFLASGCGQNVPVRGKVTFSDNQEPVTVGMVFFENDQMQARGKINEDGTYRLGTLTETDGIPPGTYRVFVGGALVADPAASPNPDRPSPPLSLIDSKFETGATSGLTFTVDRANKKFDFSVAPNLATRARLKK